MPPRMHRLHEGDGQSDRKSTRLNSSHMSISYAVFCLKKRSAMNVDERGPLAGKCTRIWSLHKRGDHRAVEALHRHELLFLIERGTTKTSLFPLPAALPT